MDKYKQGSSHKREAISTLLEMVYVRIKTITLQASDFDSLMVAQASRRLYQTEKLDPDSALIISRRFSEVYTF